MKMIGPQTPWLSKREEHSEFEKRNVGRDEIIEVGEDLGMSILI